MQNKNRQSAGFFTNISGHDLLAIIIVLDYFYNMT